jgi:hypothetical protein
VEEKRVAVGKAPEELSRFELAPLREKNERLLYFEGRAWGCQALWSEGVGGKEGIRDFNVEER